MRKKIFLFLFCILSVVVQAQVKICNLPQTASGTLHDWLIKEDSTCVSGTKKITVTDFISAYHLNVSGTGGSFASGFAGEVQLTDGLGAFTSSPLFYYIGTGFSVSTIDYADGLLGFSSSGSGTASGYFKDVGGSGNSTGLEWSDGAETMNYRADNGHTFVGPLTFADLATGGATKMLTINSAGLLSTATISTGGGGGSGTVTSVGGTGTNGVTVTGVPFTTAGALTIGLGAITPTSVTASGTIGGSNLNISNWDNAYTNRISTLTTTGSGAATLVSNTLNIPTPAAQSYPGAGIAVSTGSAWTTSLTDNSSNWNTAYTNRITSLTVTGSSGASTLSSNTLNIPTYTLAGLGGFANPMTTGGDVIYGGSSGLPTRLANGTFGQVLQSNGTTLPPSWTTDIAGSAATLTTGRTIAMTGDVTWTSPSFNGSSNVTAAGTIANDAVTYAKIQNVATNRLLGRVTSGSGDAEEITIGPGLVVNGTTLSVTASGSGTVTSVASTFTGGIVSVAGSPVTTSGTLAYTVAGTSGGIPYFSSTSAWASSALLAANNIMIGGGAGTAPSTTTTGTGVLTALGVNTGSAGAFVVNGGALGTPSSGTLTNCTFPTLNQSTTGSAATLTTPRAIYGNNFDGSAALTQIIASTYGGTGNGFTKFSGPATSEKTFTLPNASATILTDNAAVTVAQGGTGAATFLSNGLLFGNGTGAIQTAAGLTTDATSKVILGIAGTSVGSIDFKNATSGTLNLAPPTGALGTANITLPNATSTLSGLSLTETVSGAKTFTNNNIFQPTVSTGTGSSAGIQVLANSLTTGNGIDASTTTLSTGNLLKLTSTSTAGNGFSLANIVSSGANASTRTVTGQTVSVTNTGTFSTNVGLNVTASGGTNNYAAVFTGSVGIGTTSPAYDLHVKRAVAGSLVASVENTNTGDSYTQIQSVNGQGASGGLGMASANASGIWTGRAYLYSLGSAVAAPGINIAAREAAGDIRVYTGGESSGFERMRILSGGRVGIGVTAPTAMLHLKAGTTSANTAGLKLSSGTNMATPEDGAFEYDATSLTFTNAGLVRQEIPLIQQSRVTTQFDKTNTTLANITGLTATLVAGKTYRFEATLFSAVDISGGEKYSIAGTATATMVKYVTYWTDNSNVTPAVNDYQTSLGNPSTFANPTTSSFVIIRGTIVCNAAGTLTVQFAESTASGTSSVLTGSTFVVTQIP